MRGLRPVSRIAALAAAVLASSNGAAQTAEPAALVELSARELQRRLQDGTLSAAEVTRAFLDRIAALDPRGPELRAIIEVNPQALEIAQRLDLEFRRGGPVGPLHGVPVALKANIDTADGMATSAGSIALAQHHAAADAAVAARLRAAGAVLIAKTNLSEWANFRSLRSTSGWSSLGGQTRNPYVLDRNPCGSSSGSAVAVAARLVPLAVGTETDGSIVCPAGVNGVVGIKPTRGLVDNRGIVPIAESLDVAGPFARSVSDAALLLAAMSTEAAALADDAAGRPLAGVRLGVLRTYGGAGTVPAVDAAFGRWLQALEQAGAVLVDPIAVQLDAAAGEAELGLMLHEFKRGIDRYLAGVRDGPRSLEELMEFNRRNSAAVMPHFEQELFEAAASTAGDGAQVHRALVELGPERVRGMLERVFAAERIDALLAPANAPAWQVDWAVGDRVTVGSSRLAALSGYPSIVVPAELQQDLPLGITFLGKPFDEAQLIGIAAAFEALRGEFPAPQFLPAGTP